MLVAIAAFALTVNAQQKASPEKIKASKIIRMCNSVIDWANLDIQMVESYSTAVNGADYELNKLKSNMNIKPSFLNYKMYSVNQERQTEYTNASKLAPVFEEKVAMQNAVTTANADMVSIVRTTKALSDYFLDATYKTDTDFSRYAALKDSAEFYIAKGHTSWRTASRLASEAGDNAELLILKGSKLAEFIIPMKTDLMALNGMFNEVTDKNADLSEISKKLSALSTSINTNKDISTKDVKKLSDAYYREVYQTFYRKCSDATASLSKLVDIMQTDPAAEGSRLSGFFNGAASSYKDAVEKYNTFVGQ